jgi:hypothetical protein
MDIRISGRFAPDAPEWIRQSNNGVGRRLAVLDDDPTGSQAVHGVQMVTVLDEPRTPPRCPSPADGAAHRFQLFPMQIHPLSRCCMHRSAALPRHETRNTAKSNRLITVAARVFMNR